MAKRITEGTADVCICCEGQREAGTSFACRDCWQTALANGCSDQIAQKFRAMPIEAPPADPLAGVDWSRYLPKDGDARNDQGTCYSVGDVCAASWSGGAHRVVFRVENCNAVGIAGIILASNAPLLANERVSFCVGFPVQIGLIARDGKLLAQPEEFTRTRHLYNDPADRFRCQQCGKNGSYTGSVICKPDPGWRENLAATKPARVPPMAEMILGFQELVDEILAAEKEKSAPRAHDFSNPYCVDEGTASLCAECGDNRTTTACTPDPTWRQKYEETIGKLQWMRDRDRPQPPSRTPSPYRNAVAGIGATLGGYLNVAPERGR